MERIVDVAQYIFAEYKRQSGEVIDEMKLHKLLYFVQRESIAITNEPMFSECFEGWKYGPVCREVRMNYTEDGMNVADIKDISIESSYIAKNVVSQYGPIASWKLSEISHNELSWKNSRKGLKENENGNAIMSISDIRIDSQKVRPYDSVWDMYC